MLYCNYSFECESVLERPAKTHLKFTLKTASFRVSCNLNNMVHSGNLLCTLRVHSLLFLYICRFSHSQNLLTIKNCFISQNFTFTFLMLIKLSSRPPFKSIVYMLMQQITSCALRLGKKKKKNK